MSDKYKIKGVTVTLSNGITLQVEVEKLENLKDLVDDLKSTGLSNFILKPVEKDDTSNKGKGKGKEKSDDDDDEDEDESPIAKVELRADLNNGVLTSKKVLGFKNEIPQLYRPGTIVPTEALLVLLFAIENGLNINKISFDEFKAIFDGQGIKSGTPLSMLITNVKNSNYLDKKSYDTERQLSLSSKGAAKAKEILKKLVK
jgi:hypothetical protein